MNALPFRFSQAFLEVDAYRPPTLPQGSLDLSSNTGIGPSRDFRMAVAGQMETSARYPSTGEVRDALVDLLEVGRDELCVTAGGDDAIDRICRIMLEPGSNAVLPTPTFEMIGRSARRTGATVVEVPWEAEFPLGELTDSINERTRLVAVVTPNNPTGATASCDDLLALADSAPGTLILVDLAYIEFAEEDPTQRLRSRQNIVVVRTLSKAWGLASCRVGYAVGAPAVIARVQAAGGPYAVSAASAALAAAWVREGKEETNDFVRTVIDQRTVLSTRLRAEGLELYESQANFVCVKNGQEVASKLAEAGIRVRAWANTSSRAGLVRITLPGAQEPFSKLLTALFGDAPPVVDPPTRFATIRRETRETRITATLALDGSGQADISTGLGFFDHMLEALTKHSRTDLKLRCVGDLDVDDHHTIEDCAIVLGQLYRKALGDRAGTTRFGDASVPLDEALARAVVDLSGRPSPNVTLNLRRDSIGQVATENLTHFFQSLALEGRFALHVDVLKGNNDHHKAEAAFKAVARALRTAIAPDSFSDVPSTKGVLS